jgi:S1-C subfamily serine protease
MNASASRRLLRAGAAILLVLPVAALASPEESAPDPSLDEDQILRVTEGWKERVFLVVADGGPARIEVDEVLENPRTLFRNRRVGCAVYLGDARYLLTTASVVGPGTEVEVFDEDGHHVLAQVVGVDRFLDLALLRTVERLPEAEGLEDLSLDSEPPAGEPCLVLGNAWGSSLSATLGTTGGVIDVLAWGLPIRMHRVLAPIYPGDSGGPVIDEEGRFIGIITAVSRPRRPAVREDDASEIGIGPSDAPAGAIGFAVPAAECRRAWMDLHDFGVVRRAYLGVHLPAEEPNEAGARVLGVHPNSPAASAGLRAGDLITTFGDHYVTGGRQFCALVAASEPGSLVNVRLVRGSREHVVTVHLGLARRQPGLHRLPMPRSLPMDSLDVPVMATDEAPR